MDSSFFNHVPEISAPNAECPNPQAWSMYDGMATEVEVLEFLHALVCMIKPSVAVETGSYRGHGTYHIARALRTNWFGTLYTAETDAALYKRIEAMGDAEGLPIRAYHGTGVDLISSMIGPIDFAFLDSNLDSRIGEMNALLPKLSPRGIVAVHDTSTFHDRPGGGGPRTPFLTFARMNGMQVINFDTPRGLMLLRKQP